MASVAGATDVRVEGNHAFVLQTSGLSIVELSPAEIAATIEIRNNVIAPRTQQLIRVIIRGSEGFNPGEVDRTTIAFGPNAARPVMSRSRHVDRDSRLDLVVRFVARDTGIPRGASEACLTAEMLDGTPLSGCDAVRVLGGRGRGPQTGVPPRGPRGRSAR